MSRDILVRRARVDEADTLSALCHRSKRHWGYDDAFMALSAPSLMVRADAIADGRVFVAAFADEPARLLGVAELAPMDNGLIDLDKLFVDPPAIGQGAGALLFLRAALAARQSGARTLTILADPNAAAFYQRMGARFRRMAPSDAIPGRELPFYGFDLAAMPVPDDVSSAF